MTPQQFDLFAASFSDPDHDGKARMDAARSASVPTARRSDPETSRLAAADAQPRAARHRDRALAALREAGESGMSDFALAETLHLQATSVGVRRKELVDQGLVEWSGRKGTSPSGSACRIWVAVKAPSNDTMTDESRGDGCTSPGTADTGLECQHG